LGKNPEGRIARPDSTFDDLLIVNALLAELFAAERIHPRSLIKLATNW